MILKRFIAVLVLAFVALSLFLPLVAVYAVPEVVLGTPSPLMVMATASGVIILVGWAIKMKIIVVHPPTPPYGIGNFSGYLNLNNYNAADPEIDVKTLGYCSTVTNVKKAVNAFPAGNY